MNVLIVSEGKHERSGALECLTRRIAARIKSCTWDNVQRNDIQVHHGRGRGYFKKAVRWMLEARKRRYDALVLVIDEDGLRDRIRELDQAQEEHQVTDHFPRALGVAIRTFDAWMLADEHSLSKILAIAVPTQPSPEENRDPKTACVQLLEKSDCGLSQRQLYANVAEAVELARLEKRCPKGFGVFAVRLRSL